MIHRSSLIPGFSRFIDENILSHYPATSMKRILMAGGVSLYLKKGEALVETLTSNPLIAGLGVIHDGGMIELEPVRDVLKQEVNKAGFVRLSFPIIGNIDFTTDDIDALYRDILEANTQITTTSKPVNPVASIMQNNGGIY